jgi:hypothetical protein
MLPETEIRSVPEPQPTAEPEPSPTRRERRKRRSRRNKVARRTIGVVLALALVWLAWSIGTAMTAAGNDPTGTRLVEWVRDHGGNGFVDGFENWWYTNHPPPKGGVPKGGRLPSAKAPTVARVISSTTVTVPPQLVPANIPPIAPVPLPNEGVWAPTGKLVGGRAAVFQTFLRPDPVHTSLVTGVAWMDATLLRAALYNGIQLPGGGPWQRGAAIAPEDQPALVAGFNSAFKLDVSRGGYYTEGRTVRPLVDGRASLVINADGSATVGMWGRDAVMSPAIASVRQNLDLLVDNGQNLAAGDVNDTQRWGATLGGGVYVWRSGLGVDTHGNLIYVGGPGLNITTLADVLVKAGAVRAMELDINTSWVSFFTYIGGDATGPITGVKLLDNMERSPGSYLSGNSRDFVAMFAR